jgi:hypothetical protein
MTVGTAGNGMRKLSAPSSSLRMLRNLIFVLVYFFAATLAFAQGGPPYYTNDPGTPGHLNWEINLGYMPRRGVDRVRSLALWSPPTHAC